jgi:hypothetical protein
MSATFVCQVHIPVNTPVFHTDRNHTRECALTTSVYGSGRGEEPVCAERAEAGAGQAGRPGAGLTKKGKNQRRQLAEI